MIIGNNVRLRAIEREDAPRFVRWLNDPEVRRHLLVIAPLSLAGEEKWVARMQELPPHEQVLAIEAFDQDQWVHVGNTGLHSHDWINRHAEFCILIGEKQYWGRGIGLEAARLMLHYGFDTLNLTGFT